jgi:hypothetical protein
MAAGAAAGPAPWDYRRVAPTVLLAMEATEPFHQFQGHRQIMPVVAAAVVMFPNHVVLLVLEEPVVVVRARKPHLNPDTLG